MRPDRDDRPDEDTIPPTVTLTVHDSTIGPTASEPGIEEADDE